MSVLLAREAHPTGAQAPLPTAWGPGGSAHCLLGGVGTACRTPGSPPQLALALSVTCSLSKAPLGVTASCPAPQILFCCRTCWDGSGEAWPGEHVAPRWGAEAAVEGALAAVFTSQHSRWRKYFKLLDLSLPPVLAGASPPLLAWMGAAALGAALSPGPVPTVLPSLAHVAGEQPLWYSAGHPPLLPHHPEALGRGWGGGSRH